MTDIVTEAGFLRNLKALVSDKRMVVLDLSDDERALLRIALRLAVVPGKQGQLLRMYARTPLRELQLSDIFLVVNGLQHVKSGGFLRRKLTDAEQTRIKQLAYKLSLMVTDRQPELDEVIETGW